MNYVDKTISVKFKSHNILQFRILRQGRLFLVFDVLNYASK